MAARDKSCDIHINRIYEAPVELVWDAWTDPEQAAKWWGPRGFTITTHSKDLRPGGIWHYTMHGPDGTDYPNKTLYHEVVEHEKLVYDHGGNDERDPLFRVTVTFRPDGETTVMDMTMTFPTPEQTVSIGKFIKEVGGNSTWDRLAEYLGKEQFDKDCFVINRSFDAPLELMFEMWTDPEHFSKWLPPTGFEMKFLRSDIRPGGSNFYMMTNNANVTMYGRVEYKEITKPSRLVYTQSFCDEHEQMSRHPMAPVWPATMLTTVELNAEGSDQTRVTVTWQPVGNVTAEELQAFVNALPGMTMGWTGSFDKLEGVLAALSRMLGS